MVTVAAHPFKLPQIAWQGRSYSIQTVTWQFASLYFPWFLSMARDLHRPGSCNMNISRLSSSQCYSNTRKLCLSSGVVVHVRSFQAASDLKKNSHRQVRRFSTKKQCCFLCKGLLRAMYLGIGYFDFSQVCVQPSSL